MLRWLIALAGSPVLYHRVVWNDCLNVPPWTADPIVNANVRNLHDYFVSQWLMNRGKALLWNHFGRTGLCTTAEGYHNGLHSVFDTRWKEKFCWESLWERWRSCITRYTFEWSNMQLERGAMLNPRRAAYVQNDANLEMAKQSLQDWLDIVHEPALRNAPANIPLEQHEAYS